MKGQSGKDMVFKIKKKSFSFQEIIINLQKYWSKKGCVILQPYDMEVGAGTFIPLPHLDRLAQIHGGLHMFNLREDQQMEDMEIIQIDCNIITSFKF